MSISAEIRKTFSAALEGIVGQFGFQRVGSPPQFIRRHGPVFLSLSVDVRAQMGEITVTPLMRWWHMALSTSEDLNSRKLNWLIQHHGIEECYAAPNFLTPIRFSNGEDIADALASMRASFSAEMIPFLSAITCKEDVALAYSLAPNLIDDEQKIRTTVGILGAAADDSGFGVPDSRNGSDLPFGRYELVDETRWHCFADSSDFGMSLALAGFFKHRVGRPPLSAEGVIYVRQRDVLFDIVNVSLGRYGMETEVSCYAWIPELNGLCSRGFQSIPDGVVPIPYSKQYLDGGELWLEPTVMDFSEISARPKILRDLAKAVPRMEAYFSTRLTAESIFALPPISPTISVMGSSTVLHYQEGFERWKSNVLNLLRENEDS